MTLSEMIKAMFKAGKADLLEERKNRIIGDEDNKVIPPAPGMDIDEGEIEEYFDTYCETSASVTTEIIDEQEVNVLNLGNVDFETSGDMNFLVLNADNTRVENNILIIE